MLKPNKKEDDEELLQKCLNGAISQKDLPSYKSKYDAFPEIDEFKGQEEDFYERQTHAQLVIFCHNHDHIEKSLRERLKALTGCEEYGRPDGMDGSCVDCYYNDRKLWEKCYKFASQLRQDKT